MSLFVSLALLWIAVDISNSVQPMDAILQIIVAVQLFNVVKWLNPNSRSGNVILFFYFLLEALLTVVLMALACQLTTDILQYTFPPKEILLYAGGHKFNET